MLERTEAMQGKHNGIPVHAKVPKGWVVAYYGDREQPWTLYRALNVPVNGRSYEVIRFCDTAGDAVRVSQLKRWGARNAS